MGTIIAALRLLPIGAQIGIFLAILGAAGGGFLTWRAKLINQGAEHERARQEEKDDAARSRGRQGRNAVDTCYDLGGVWDVKVGVCRR